MRNEQVGIGLGGNLIRSRDDMNLESILITAILIITLLMFVFVFAIVVLSFIKWSKLQEYKPLAIRVEDYACPKCGSKKLEMVGGRTLKCKKCGTVFSIQTKPQRSDVLL